MITALKIFYNLLTDYDFMFNCFYILFIIFALTIHHFFFVINLITDFLRIEYLKNVWKSVYKPKY